MKFFEGVLGHNSLAIQLWHRENRTIAQSTGNPHMAVAGCGAAAGVDELNSLPGCITFVDK